MKNPLVLIFILLIACSPRGEITIDPQAAAVGSIQPIFYGTTRNLEADGSYGTKRSEITYFGKLDISVPPDRKLGEIKWPPRHGKANPEVDFLTVNQIRYSDEQAFRKAFGENMARHNGEVTIFVHGFNNNFPEGIYRVAQFSHDLNLPSTVVEYGWPSAANPLGYVYDRDSALFARNGLENLINEAVSAGAKRIVLVAHSMGGALMMETLRSMAIRGDKKALGRLGGVVLISPDIDVDVFREQAHSIGTLPQPFVIFGSNRDKVLRISAGLTGQSARLGSLSNISSLADLKVTFLDVADFSTGAGHFVPASSPALLALLKQIAAVDGAFEADRRSRIGLLPGAILTVQNATEIVLSPVGAVASDLTK